MTRMSVRNSALLAGLMLLTCAAAASASPFKISLPFKRVEADPSKSYEVQDEHGPWLIMAASFLGDAGERQARELVMEFRQRYKMPAYIYKKRFDYPEEETGLGVDKYGRPKKMKPIHAVQFDEIAVLVGDFDSVDDPQAQKALDRIKHLNPDSLKSSRTKPTSQRMALWREIQRQVFPDDDRKRMGPMRAAFITRNPVLPAEYFAQQGPDAVILELNRGLDHSLLDCPGQYTVRVATFRGHATWNVAEIERAKRERPDADNSKLVEAADKASRLTNALRKRGIEAYQFHDRHESIVTIGSFESVGVRRADGKIEINPAIHEVMKTYAAVPENLPGIPGAMRPYTLEGIAFDAQPLPVQVPRLSIASQFSRNERSFR